MKGSFVFNLGAIKEAIKFEEEMRKVKDIVERHNYMIDVSDIRDLVSKISRETIIPYEVVFRSVRYYSFKLKDVRLLEKLYDRVGTDIFNQLNIIEKLTGDITTRDVELLINQ